MRRVLPLGLLILAIAAGTALRVTMGFAKPAMYRDEAVSFLAAAGHQDHYAKMCRDGTAPIGQWVPVAQWKRFMLPDKPLCFLKIRDTLATYDRHPPLYFWLLHMWVLVVGVHLWTGPILNAVVAAIGAVVLYLLARRVLGHAMLAAVVAFCWSVSPAVIATGIQARHYDLLALWSTLLALMLLRYSEANRRLRLRDHAALLATTTAGALTHYLFWLATPVFALFWIATLARRQRSRLLRMLACIAAGYLLAAMIHPGFYKVLRPRPVTQPSISWAEFDARVDACLLVAPQFFVVSARLAEWVFAHKYVVLAGVAVLGLGWLAFVIVAGARRRKAGSRHPGDPPDPRRRYVPYLVVALLLLLMGTYLACLTPQHAMRERYLSMVWPFLALLLVMLIARSSRARVPLAVLLCAAMLAGGTTYVRQYARKAGNAAHYTISSLQADRVVLDTIERIPTLRTVWALPDRMFVLAAKQPWLIEHPAEWMDADQPTLAYIAFRRYGNTRADRQAILTVLSHYGRLRLLGTKVLDMADVFELHRNIRPRTSLPAVVQPPS